jgi:hypothetical protein
LQKEIAEIISKNALVPRDYAPVKCMGLSFAHEAALGPSPNP